MRPRFEVADVLRAHWPAVEHCAGINSWQLRTLAAIMRCRNRHCPKCQGRKREEWILAREAELLPVPYFHVVFTLPDTLNLLALRQPKLVYDTLFEAAWQTLLTFATDRKHLGARPGMVAVLHT